MDKPRLEPSTRPDRNLTPKEQQRVRNLVARLCNERQVPQWAIWTALYRFVAQQVSK